MTLAVLGLGAMGARMATRLLDAGHDLTVWNRSPGPADALRPRAAVAATPRQAAAGADVVLSMVTDDDASRAVWTGPDGALAGLAAGAVAVESSTLTPAWVRELAPLAAERGATLLDAPVAGTRGPAEAGTLVFLVGGDARALARVRPALDAMGQAVHHVGETGRGAEVKLAINALYAVQVAAYAEWAHALRRAGVGLDRTAEVLSALPITSPAAAGALRSVAAGAFDPQFPVDLVEKDLGYAVRLAESVGADAPATAAAHATFARALAAGLGDLNATGVARVFDER